MGSNLSTSETFTSTSAPAVRTAPVSPFNLLTVKILRVRNARKADLFTLSDCYVTLWLPTASAEKVRTRTIRNCKNPVWNEAFCYKIDRRVKNVLELKVCDEDTVTRDDELCTVLFDIDKLTVGRTVRVKFQLNPQAREELEVEFTLQNTELPFPGVVFSKIINGTIFAMWFLSDQCNSCGMKNSTCKGKKVLHYKVQHQNEPIRVATGTGSRWSRWLRSLNIPLPSDFY